MPVKRNLLKHFLLVQDALKHFNGEAYLNAKTFFLELHLGAHSFTMYPQFVVFVDGKTKRYSATFSPEVVRFAGWRPYVNKMVQEFTDKLQVKKQLINNGFNTPAHLTESNNGMSDVIIKLAVSSFGDTIRGPFKTSAGINLDPQAGEYFEQFIRGQIIKAWFWNGVPICFESEDMPTITGNGIHTIKQLVLGRTAHLEIKNLRTIEDVLLYQEKSMDTVLADGESILIDFRNASKFAPMNNIKDNLVSTHENRIMTEQLFKIGRFFIDMVPERIRTNFAFTVDAILDENNKLWFLEVNTNPIIHPYLYPYIVESLTKSRQQLPAGNVLH